MTIADLTFPDVDLLCYQQTSPMLRVVNPRTGSERPFGMMKKPGQSIDRAVMRDGWIAAWAGATYRRPLGDGAKAKSLGRGWPFVPAVDPRCVWICDGVGTWAEYDGIDDQVRRRIDLGVGHLHGAVTHGLLVRYPGRSAMALVDPDDPTSQTHDVAVSDGAALDLVACIGDTIVWSRSPAHLSVLDLSIGSTSEIRLPLWRRHRREADRASLSPDRRWLAITGDAIVGPVPFDIDPKERARRKRQGSTLVLVDLIEATAELVDGFFEGSAHSPVWSRDGSWVFFGAPFENAMFAAPFAATSSLRRVEGAWRNAAMPLLDLDSPA